jgi:hypothetical protein
LRPRGSGLRLNGQGLRVNRRTLKTKERSLRLNELPLTSNGEALSLNRWPLGRNGRALRRNGCSLVFNAARLTTKGCPLSCNEQVLVRKDRRLSFNHRRLRLKDSRSSRGPHRRCRPTELRKRRVDPQSARNGGLPATCSRSLGRSTPGSGSGHARAACGCRTAGNVRTDRAWGPSPEAVPWGTAGERWGACVPVDSYERNASGLP